MMKAVKITALISLIVVLTTPVLADFSGGSFRWYSGTNYVTLYSPAQVRLNTISGSGSGGAFSVDAKNGSLPVWGSGNGLFTTYCVESQITFSPGSWYWCSVNTNAYSGNMGLAGDPISDVTEWIYDKWLSGNASGWTQDEISKAIWYAEGETGGSATAPYNAALNHFGYTSLGQFGLATHTKALNLWGNIHYDPILDAYVASDVQTHLIHIPVPAAALLGVFGLGLAGWVKRRMV